MSETQHAVRQKLTTLLDGGNAHMSFSEVVEDFPAEQAGLLPPDTPYSLWHFVEHIRIAQWDILEYIRNPDHISPDYPMGYRPPVSEPGSAEKWQRSVGGVLAGLEDLKALIREPSRDLFAPLPHDPDYSVFRGILTAAAHNSYHIGELAILRQVTGLWPAGKEYLTGRPD